MSDDPGRDEPGDHERPDRRSDAPPESHPDASRTAPDGRDTDETTTEESTPDESATDETGASVDGDVDETGDGGPPSLRVDRTPRPSPLSDPGGFLRWALTTQEGTVAFVREILSSVLVVALIGLVLFGVSGVWPPMVAVESGSMTPHMQPGDLVLVVSQHRYVPSSAFEDTGVVTYDDGASAGYRKFGSYGDVIVYQPPKKNEPPIIHRARFWVSAGENWYPRANKSYVNADACGATPDEKLRNCPAPHAGFITKGDANPYYDQAWGIAPPVEPSWIRGTAEARVPYLGCVRLWFLGNPPAACRL